MVGHFPYVNKLKGSCSQVVCEMVVCHAKQQSCRGLGISRFLASFACQRIKGVLKKKFSNRWQSCNKCRIFRLGRYQDSPRAFKVHDHCPSIFHAAFFQQHANNQEIDTIANCHATFQYTGARDHPEDGA